MYLEFNTAGKAQHKTVSHPIQRFNVVACMLSSANVTLAMKQDYVASLLYDFLPKHNHASRHLNRIEDFSHNCVAHFILSEIVE